MRRSLASLLLLSLLSSAVFSQEPQSLHFQARLSDAGGNPLNGPVSVTVRVYAAPIGGSPLFAETHAATALNGVVNLAVGSLVSVPAGLFESATRYFAVQVGADPEMLPRREIVGVPYALRAATAAALTPTTLLPTGLITSAHILDGTIVGADLATGSVSSAQIVDGSVIAADLAASSVTSAKIAASAVTTAAIANLAVTTAKIADAAVDDVKIKDGSITAAKLAASAVTSASVSDGSLTGADLLNGTITSAKLAAASVSTATLADGSVTLPKLAHPLVGSAAGPALEIESSSTTGIALQADATALT